MDTIRTNTRNEETRLLNVESVATIAGMTQWVVRHLHRAGKHRGKVQAGRLYWHSAAVRMYVQNFREGAAPFLGGPNP